MRIFVDGPWSEDVRLYDTPMRIYVHTKHWMWMIGLWPTIKAQVWNGTEGYTDEWAWITWHPKGNLHPADVCGTPIVYISNRR